MANFKMIDWYIIDKLPYPVLGSMGENNASTITIQIDALINDAKYYLDITDKNGNETATQELTPLITQNNNDEYYILSMKPQVDWLGKKGAKLLQIRCVYENNNEQIVKKSNIIHAVVNNGVLLKSNNNNNNNNSNNYNNNNNTIINLFEQYFQKIKSLIENISINENPIPISTVEHVYVDMKDVGIDGELTLDINKYYHIIDSRYNNQGVTKLSIVLNPSDDDGDYHFDFISSNPNTQLILPNNILIPSNLSINTNSYYNMIINPYSHVMTCTSQGLH